MTILNSINKSLQRAALYNQHDLAAPRVILWPDEDRLWFHCIESLRHSYPELWTLGDYAPDLKTGPAVWLRYQLEAQEGNTVPVIYLPGISRSAFRKADQCPNKAKHLFALQFQGQFWTQKNGKDWTPFAFFSSADGGLGLDVASDQDTRLAIQESLPKLMATEINALQGRKLEASDFRAVIITDAVQTLLRWMNDPDATKLELQKSGSEWSSFCSVCRDQYGFNPDKDGAITAAEKIPSGKPEWNLVWSRFKESPQRYPNIRKLLETPGQMTLFEKATEYNPGANRQEEERLEAALLALSNVSQKEALEKIKTLAGEHKHRSEWVWAELGESPLAKIIGYLQNLAEVVESSGNPSSWEALAEYYSTIGWKADYSVLRALGTPRSSTATKSVTTAIRTLYLPWLEKLSVHAQALATSYPNSGPNTCRSLAVEDGTIYLFADGLRMDIAKALEERLNNAGDMVDVAFDVAWSALPTVTATAKPAWLPLAAKLGGPLEGAGFEPKELSNAKILTHTRFKQLVEELGITFLTSEDTLFPVGCAWTEYGSLDKYGHEQGVKLAWRLDEELAGLQQRIAELLQSGWAKVKVITDHGWLLLPGGLPKTELPKHLTATRWSRCAIPDAGAQHGYPLTSCFWDRAESVVLAPGVSCFVAGMEYAHGGLTLQEALIPSLTITASKNGSTKQIALKEFKWSGLRLHVVLDGAEGYSIDIRRKVADASTTIVVSPVIGVGSAQKNSLLVSDDDALGTMAFLVVLDQKGQPVFKHSVHIGEN
ncbi:MAG: BREX-1 system phosphatase PglZ type B [Desulfobulbaceae bacterium]|nr:BREX-1 system phosphatase PglZ type B [Desulfobulbaceae bacterium]